MNFMSTSSSSPSSSFHYRTTTVPPHHQYGGRRSASASDDAGEDNEDHVTATTTMPLFARSEAHDITTDDANTIPAALVEKEHMFDKVVTPSDVGKLNRLVIPKQYAEKYFPLDSSTNEKGLLLNFEDRNGKPWRFRYSYWNSSQSYVMTKGWSRFVKDKKLDAGDIVSFQRGTGELGKDRLFIDWRRRPDAPDLMIPPSHAPLHHQFSYHRSLNPWINASNPVFLQPHHHDYGGAVGTNSTPPPYNCGTIVNGNPCPPGSVLYLRSGNESGFYAPHQKHMGMLQFQRSGGDIRAENGGGGTSCNELQQQMVFDSVPVVRGKAAAKRLRLFGVNMDCPIPDDQCDRVLSSTATLAHPTMPMFRNFGGFDSSSSSVPSQQYSRSSYNDHDQEEDDKGKGTSMSLDLDI